MATDIDYTIRLTREDAKKLDDIKLCYIYQRLLQIKKSDHTLSAVESRNFEIVANVLLKRYEGLIVNVSSKYLFHFKTVDYSDIVSSGKMGFLEAVEKFTDEYSHGPQNSTLGVYARFIITRYILDFINSNKTIIKQPLTRDKKIIYKFIQEKQSESWSHKDIAEAMIKEGYAKTINDSYKIIEKHEVFNKFVSLNEVVSINHTRKVEIIDIIEDPNHVNSENALDEKVICKKVRECTQIALSKMTPMQKEVFLLAQGINEDLEETVENYSYREIAEVLFQRGITSRRGDKISFQYVRVIFNQAKEIVKTVMISNNINLKLLQN